MPSIRPDRDKKIPPTLSGRGLILSDEEHVRGFEPFLFVTILPRVGTFPKDVNVTGLCLIERIGRNSFAGCDILIILLRLS
jgi:hypothetical protein